MIEEKPPTKRGPNNPAFGSVKEVETRVALCRDCGKRMTTSNALAWAHNHVKYTGHRVDLKMEWIVEPRPRD